MDMRHLVGAIIATFGPLDTTHEGIVYGADIWRNILVIENSKQKGEVSISYLWEFCGDGGWWVKQFAPRGREGEIINRALSLLGRKYHLTDYNCQHFASEVYTGIPRSWELARAGYWPEIFGLRSQYPPHDDGC
jgi:hypothetical protein